MKLIIIYIRNAICWALCAETVIIETYISAFEKNLLKALQVYLI